VVVVVVVVLLLLQGRGEVEESDRTGLRAIGFFCSKGLPAYTRLLGDPEMF
jgi:hypothetical protein